MKFIEDLKKDMSHSSIDAYSTGYDGGYNFGRESLKFPTEIISFIDSCGFDCEQLRRIMVGIEGIKGSDYGDTRTDDFDTYDAQRDAELETL